MDSRSPTCYSDLSPVRRQSDTPSRREASSPARRYLRNEAPLPAPHPSIWSNSPLELERFWHSLIIDGDEFCGKLIAAEEGTNHTVFERGFLSLRIWLALLRNQAPVLIAALKILRRISLRGASELALQPAGNVPIIGTGYVGFWAKINEAGTPVRIAIDDPVPAGSTAIEMGATLNLIADNQWHLDQWNLQDVDQWFALGNAGSDGDIDATSGSVTIDSIWLAGTGNAQIYLDNVMHNPIGLITPDYTFDITVSETSQMNLSPP